MKTMGLILGIFITSFLSTKLQAQKATITVTIENIGSHEGQVLASLHTAETFLKGPGIRNAKSEAETESVVMTFEEVDPGTYAISSLHDLNGNFQMDYEANGMPGEPWAISGNTSASGPPLFSQAKFEVMDQQALQLTILFE